MLHDFTEVIVLLRNFWFDYQPLVYCCFLGLRQVTLILVMRPNNIPVVITRPNETHACRIALCVGLIRRVQSRNILFKRMEYVTGLQPTVQINKT